MDVKVFLLSAALNVAWAAYTMPAQDTSTCPPTFRNNHPLILVSMDGFRADYLLRGKTPTIQALGNMGVRAPYVKPSYPTITFPNHYTIATGMYPPSHGIIANKFYDPVFRAEFRLGNPESFKKRWWGGEPIWRTAERQGKRAATYYWPGSEVDGNQPTFWFKYNESIPFEHRVDQVLAWLDLPAETRPSFMTLYMHEPDNMGHIYGPDAPMLNTMLTRVDNMVKRLLDGLKVRNLFSCVNLLVVSDHGMVEAGEQRVLRLDSYIPNIVNRTRFWDGVFGRMTPNDGSQKTKEEMMRALSCKRPEMRVYEKTSLPIRWHVGRQRRIEDIVLDMDAGFSVGGDNTYKADAGDHGYDNYFSSMNAMFVAHGPDIRQNIEVEAFQNIELYNLMCHLLGVTPAPNNGTWGSLHRLLAHPPPAPYSAAMEFPPPIAKVPASGVLSYGYYEPQVLCEGDLHDDDEWLEMLQEAQEESNEVIIKHLPWGLPQMGKTGDFTYMLLQPDFVSAYSSLVKMPLWTSFTLETQSRGSRAFSWRSDVRLGVDQRIPCSAYQTLAPLQISPQPLFPPEFTGRDECGQLPYLMSNSAPFTHFLTQRWKQLIDFVKKWKYRYGIINVVTGPVFDYDADTFVDDLHIISQGGDLVVPTHMFLVVTRCMVWVDNLAKCPHNYLDSLAFVYPQTLTVSNCLNAEQFAREFSATVQDVEKITGIKFYPHLYYEHQVRLRLRVHSNIWGRESWLNRIRSDVFGLTK
ncbi:venom phosphodiesterase 2-like [Homarus americanus]|uniref:venom phosphodiesterase 2-like n=1 Tax=Homarus americanus TaxID=6706 RepID=UPI001C48CD6C|nr:venom phosphodiesterase 2-like [Homarus americanus]